MHIYTYYTNNILLLYTIPVQFSYSINNTRFIHYYAKVIKILETALVMIYVCTRITQHYQPSTITTKYTDQYLRLYYLVRYFIMLFIFSISFH